MKRDLFLTGAAMLAVSGCWADQNRPPSILTPSMQGFYLADVFPPEKEVGELCSLDEPDGTFPNGHAALVLRSVERLSDTTLKPQPLRVEWKGFSPKLGDLVVTELMVNPQVVQDYAGEYIEIANTTEYPIDLKGMVVRDERMDGFVVSRSLIVEPHGLVVMGRKAAQEINGGVKVDYAYGGAMSLTNTEDEVILEFGGVTIDEVAYNAKAWKIPVGAALELDPMATDHTFNDTPVAWCPSVSPLPGGDTGSPATANGNCE